MSPSKLWFIPACMLWLGPTICPATEVPTRELGERLFQAAELGGEGKSCASCHQGGHGLQGISAYSDEQLKEMINFCIRDAIGGQMFDQEGQELESLLLYLRSLKQG